MDLQRKSRHRELHGVNKRSVLCEIISGVILSELANSNHSSTLGVATQENL